MAFQKGNKLGKGRPKGMSNIATMEKKGLVKYLKEEGADRFIRELHSLEGKEFCQAYIPVIEIAFPKQSRVETTSEIKADIKFSWDDNNNNSIQPPALPAASG